MTVTLTFLTLIGAWFFIALCLCDSSHRQRLVGPLHPGVWRTLHLLMPGLGSFCGVFTVLLVLVPNPISLGINHSRWFAPGRPVSLAEATTVLDFEREQQEWKASLLAGERPVVSPGARKLLQRNDWVIFCALILTAFFGMATFLYLWGFVFWAILQHKHPALFEDVKLET